MFCLAGVPSGSEISLGGSLCPLPPTPRDLSLNTPQFAGQVALPFRTACADAHVALSAVEDLGEAIHYPRGPGTYLKVCTCTCIYIYIYIHIQHIHIQTKLLTYINN